MGIDSRMALLSRAAVLGGLTIAITSLSAAANDLNRQSLDRQSGLKFIQIAQAGDTSCRQTNAVAGVYLQPDPVSVSQGVLPAGQTVRLEVVGTGTGWSRIREPIVGWVEARYLTPPTPCTYPASSQANQTAPTSGVSANLASVTNNPAPALQVTPQQSIARSPINTAPSSFPPPNAPQGQPQVTVPPLSSVGTQNSAVTQTSPQPQPVPQQNNIQQNNTRQNNIAARPTVPPLPAIMNPRTAPSGRAIVTTTCDVLPREGLIVRQLPNLTSPGTSLIPAGTYNFQFTGATQTVGRQRLAYIVAPAEGWIPVGTLDGVSNLGGGRCG